MRRFLPTFRPNLFKRCCYMSTDLLISVPLSPKSKSQQLAKLLPGIEAALAEGYSHGIIYEHIKNTLRLEITYKYYKTTLHRIRKRAGQVKAATSGRPSLPRPVNKNSTIAEQSDLDAVATPDHPDRRFSYDVKGPIDKFF
jgi:hypothetical protein